MLAIRPRGTSSSVEVARKTEILDKISSSVVGAASLDNKENNAYKATVAAVVVPATKQVSE